jgi:hypothetical protein
MEPATIAEIISGFSLMVAVVNSVFTAKTYKKNRWLEFLQRRDRFSQKISELNERNMEAQLISARYALVVVKNAGLQLEGEQAERNTALIASIKVQQEGVENGKKLWDKNIERLHLIYSNLTLEIDAHEVESMIAALQVAADDLQKLYGGYSATLHILETTNELMKANLAERDEKIRQINLDFDRAVERINLDYDRAVERLSRRHARV